jgi:sarcosine oxidase, subunit gamma
LTRKTSEGILETNMIAKESPLKGMNVGTVVTVSVREVPGLYTVDLRVAAGTPAHAAIVESMGIDLPAKPGKIQVGPGDAYALCLAPDSWLIVGLHDVERKVAPLKDEHHFSVVDVSGQRTTIELEGPKVREVLAHLWDHDLREKSFPVGSVSQGLMAKAPVIVCHVAPLRYRVMVRSSFAVHAWKALVDAAEEWRS